MKKIRQYEFVIEINRCGSVSKAARHLNLSQPTLSKYLASLEEEIGMELFDRTTIPLRPTEAGRRYIAAGEWILKIYHKLEEDFAEISAGMTNSVRVGISPTRAHFILPGLIRNFQIINPTAKIIIKEDTASALNASLQRNEIDLIISLKNDKTKLFESIPLFQERTVLAVPKAYKDDSVEKICRECPFISPNAGNYLSDMLFHILYKYERRAPLIEAQSIESVLVLVNDGVGAGFVPSYVMERCLYPDVVFKEIPKSVQIEDYRQICVFYRRGKELTKSEQDFIRAVKELY